MTDKEKIKEIGEWMTDSPCTPSQAAMIGAEEMADFKDRQYLTLLDTLIKSGADPQIVYDFIIINDIDVGQIISIL